MGAARVVYKWYAEQPKFLCNTYGMCIYMAPASKHFLLCKNRLYISYISNVHNRNIYFCSHKL